jgi:hypothetical protein
MKLLWLMSLGLPAISYLRMQPLAAPFVHISFPFSRDISERMFGFREEKRGAERSEDQEELLNDSERSSLDTRPRSQSTRGPSWLTITIAIVCTAILSASCGALAVQSGRLDADAFSIRHTSQYCMSP